MEKFFAIIGIVLSFFIIKYREKIGENFAEYDWMRYVGGVYGVVVIAAILIFFWSIATLTNTTDFFFAPLRFLLPFVFKKE